MPPHFTAIETLLKEAHLVQ